MTHDSRKRFPRLAVAAVALAAGVALAGSTAASAGVTPSPSPTPTVTVTPVPAPTPRHVLHFRPQAFIVHADTANPGGTAFLSGVLNGLDLGNFADGPADVWTGPTGTLHVFHTPAGPVTVDPFTCTANLDQTGRWALVGARAFAFGRFHLTERAILARGIFGQCLGLRAEPRWFDVQVLGVGQALRLRLHERSPHLSPSLTPVS
jgi:hypothetical protein